MSDPESALARSIVPVAASSNSQKRMKMVVPAAGPFTKAALKRKLLMPDEDDTKDFSELDPLILAELLSHLSLKTLAACRLACKKFDTVTTSNPNFMTLRRKHVPDQILLQPKPTWVDIGLSNLFLVDHETEESMGIIVPLSDKEITCSYDGLLCVKEHDRKIDPLFLYNPITRMLVTLPTCEPKRLYTSYVVSLGLDSRSRRYKLVRHYRFERGHKVRRLEILTVGVTSWRRIECALPEGHSYRALFCKGVFYFQFIWRQFEPKVGKVWKVAFLVIESSSEKTHIVHFPHYFESKPFVEMLDVWGRVTLIEHERYSIKKWALTGNKATGYTFEYEGVYNTGVRWTSRTYFETLCQVDVHTYIARFTTWGHDPDNITRYSPAEVEPYEMVNIPFMTHRFKARMFTPSFVDPIPDAGLGD